MLQPRRRPQTLKTFRIACFALFLFTCFHFTFVALAVEPRETRLLAFLRSALDASAVPRFQRLQNEEEEFLDEHRNNETGNLFIGSEGELGLRITTRASWRQSGSEVCSQSNFAHFQLQSSLLAHLKSSFIATTLGECTGPYSARWDRLDRHSMDSRGHRRSGTEISCDLAIRASSLGRDARHRGQRDTGKEGNRRRLDLFVGFGALFGGTTMDQRH